METNITFMMVSPIICFWEMMSLLTVLSLTKRICITLPMGEEILAIKSTKGKDTKAIAHTFQAHFVDWLKCNLVLFGNGAIKIC
jgi:hypothetical protein